MSAHPLTPAEEMRKWLDLCEKLFEETPEAERKDLYENLERLRKQTPAP